MSATKAPVTFQASGSNAAGGTTTGTGIDLTTGYGCTVTAKVTNGATGPTVGCTVSVEVSSDNTNWKTFASALADTANSAVSEFVFDIPAPVLYARTKFSGNTGQAVTVEAFGHHLTAI